MKQGEWYTYFHTPQDAQKQRTINPTGVKYMSNVVWEVGIDPAGEWDLNADNDMTLNYDDSDWPKQRNTNVRLTKTTQKIMKFNI